MDQEEFRPGLLAMLPQVDSTPSSGEIASASQPATSVAASEPATSIARHGRSMTADEYRRRPWISREGPWRPLGALVARENELETQSAALIQLANVEIKRPDPNLLVHQLTRSVDLAYLTGPRAKELKQDTLRLYSALRPTNPVDSMLCRQIVALHNAAMGSLGRAANTANLRSQEVNLRYGLKAASVFGELSKLRNVLSGHGGESISVGQVRVEAGGQAIVGRVEVTDRRKKRSAQQKKPGEKSSLED